MIRKLLIGALSILAVSFISAQSGYIPNKSFQLLQLAKKHTDGENYEIISFADSLMIVSFNKYGASYLFFQSIDFAENCGYKGVTNLAVCVDSSFSVSYVDVISSPDTPFYMKKLKAACFYKDIINAKSLSKVRLVSGATISSEAILENLREAIDWIEIEVRKDTENLKYKEN